MTAMQNLQSNTPVQYRFRDVFPEIPEAPETLTIPGYAKGDNPYIPAQDPNYCLLKSTLKAITGFLSHPAGDALFITGPTGSGKTSSILEIAARLFWPTQSVTCHGRMELTDLIGIYGLSSKAPGQAPEMAFEYGPLAVAMRDGHILVLNEVDMMEPSELSGLNDILEGRPLVIAQNGGEMIKPHPMFRVVVTGNTSGNGDSTGLYAGTMIQNLAAMDRYRMIHVGYLPAEVESKVLAKSASDLPEFIRESMINVANDIRYLFVGDDASSQQLSITMSTRTLKRWATLTLLFGHMSEGLEQALLLRANPSDREAIERIAKDTFGEQWK